MALLESILIGVAAKVGAPLVKGILEKAIGGRGGKVAGQVAGQVIDAIAGRAGVKPDELPDLVAAEPAIVEEAVAAIEAETPELILAHVESQRLSIELQLAEMAKEPWWAWAWRPGWMWLLGLLWLCRLIVLPIADAVAGTAVASAADIGTMMTLTSVFLGLYMGGHTAKDIATKAIDAYRAKT